VEFGWAFGHTRTMSLPIDYCTDVDLNYIHSHYVFSSGQPLTFDHAYRLAHLPLIAPKHPAAIHQLGGQDYNSGRYEKARYSLVVPIPSKALLSSPVFQAFERELRAARFAQKVAWALCDQRASKLHATIINGLAADRIEACAAAVARAVRKLGRLSLRLGGPFAGNKNLGRLYFPVYPQRVNGDDAFGLIQDAAGAARTRFYSVGYYNLVEELDVAETDALAKLIHYWNSRIIAEVPVPSFVVHATNDDLALSGRPVITIALDGIARPHA
jgi:hypothetical protein